MQFLFPNRRLPLIWHAILLLSPWCAWGAISLEETLTPSALHDLRRGPLRISGSASPAAKQVTVRVTDSAGNSHLKKLPVGQGKFTCQYPTDFAGAALLRPGLLFIDATETDFDVFKKENDQAEAAVILHWGRTGLPDFPDTLTSDLLDASGGRDMVSAKWPAVRNLVNLYMQSRGARKAGAARRGFDLARPDDFRFFQDYFSFYDFAHRDRDWSTPLGNRPARTFWQASYKNWFNSSNDNPLDGNPSNPSPDNYRPYGFSNDFSDWLILYWMRTRTACPFDPNLLAMSRDASRNLLALQHRGAENFALVDSTGKQEHFTAGAFRYGFFVTGEYLTEGAGWFYNPKFRDYAMGGVLNGRCVWGIGEALRNNPGSTLAAELKEAMRLALKFCLHDSLAVGYTKKTKQGNLYWRSTGEHAYLLLGMLAAYEVAPDLEIPMGPGEKAVALRELCITGLNALVDLKHPDQMWSPYPNEDAMVLPALAQGAAGLKDAPDAARWLETATQVADRWLAARIDPEERTAPCIQFGYRKESGAMSLKYMNMGRVQVYYYITGHWIHALSDLYAATGDMRYLQRALALVSDLCGKNPLRVRLLTETGGVYNCSDDTDGDGLEDRIRQDMYPESTAFSQIGILRLIRSLPEPAMR